MRAAPRLGTDVAPRLWIVDPLAQTLEVYHLGGGRWTLEAVHAADELVRAAPFDAIELALARWWLPEGPATP